MNDNFPVVIKSFYKNVFFGLISIRYHIEDRKTPCSSDRYKHFLEFRIFYSVYAWTFRTDHDYIDLPIKRTIDQ